MTVRRYEVLVLNIGQLIPFSKTLSQQDKVGILWDLFGVQNRILLVSLPLPVWVSFTPKPRWCLIVPIRAVLLAEEPGDMCGAVQ